jgi:hypothetical protein
MSSVTQVFQELEAPTVPPARAPRKSRKTENILELAPIRFPIHDATTLLMTEATPVNYVIPQWLPEGLTLLVASPKLGKTTLALQLVLALVRGAAFWGHDVPQGKALMVDLETNERRLRRKLEHAGITQLEPGCLYYATAWPRGQQGVDEIARVLDEEPEIRLVVIDTLQRFRDAGNGKQNAYAADYEALAPLQQLCRDRAGLSILVVHHKRKAAVDDPVDSVNGSAAIAGAADGIWIMSRKGAEYTLHIQARDWERDEDTFAIERDNGTWRLIDGPRFSPNEAEVLKHLEIAGGMTGPQLGEALGIHRVTAAERLKRMRDAGLVRYDGKSWMVAV